MKYTNAEIYEFIKESNAIEDVWDDTSIAESLKAWRYLHNNVGTLYLNDILTAHKYILNRLEPHYAGKLRGELGIDVFIGYHKAVDYWQVGSRVCDWLRHVNDKKLPQWDEETIKRFHISFEDIHPFGDGNGRIGRLIYCWMREKMGLPIHIIYEKEKQEYYKWFRR